ncbi:MAG: RloB domain-containing protein [Candidatus Cloacimonas sp.]|nr:RloB domain-containing protein [Candidatus Cloacimonas sp.]HNX02135.1 RloB family protein [Candidatus Cloacimonas sp.]HPS59801.1 RloB family protein [Candidatus Cloacimonas sp.]
MSYARKSKKRVPRKIFIFTEGSVTEQKYFREFIQFFKISQAQVKVIDRETSASSPKSVMEAMDYYKSKINSFTTKNDIYCMVIDTDRWGKNLKEAVADAHQRRYLVALSNPCFEIWLLMHFQDAETILKNADLLKTKADINTQIHSYHITGKNDKDYFPRTDSAVNTAAILDIKPQERLLQQIGSRVYLLINILQEYI